MINTSGAAMNIVHAMNTKNLTEIKKGQAEQTAKTGELVDSTNKYLSAMEASNKALRDEISAKMSQKTERTLRMFADPNSDANRSGLFKEQLEKLAGKFSPEGTQDTLLKTSKLKKLKVEDN